MTSESRQKHIEELKALRAELLSKQNEGESSNSSESSSHNEAMASMRKAYLTEYSNHQTASRSLSETRSEVYSQYQNASEHQEGEEQQQENALKRGR